MQKQILTNSQVEKRFVIQKNENGKCSLSKKIIENKRKSTVKDTEKA